MSDFDKTNLYAYDNDGEAVWYTDALSEIILNDEWDIDCLSVSIVFGISAGEVREDAERYAAGTFYLG